jgi:hypothetical protein
MVLKKIKIDQEDNMVKKTTEEITKNILDIDFENISKEKEFDDKGYMEDQDSSREDNDYGMEGVEEVAEVVPISKDKGPLEKDVYPQGRREKFKNKDKPNPFKKA